MTNHSAVVSVRARAVLQATVQMSFSSAELIQAPAANVAEFVAQLRREFVGAIVNSLRQHRMAERWGKLALSADAEPHDHFPNEVGKGHATMIYQRFGRSKNCTSSLHA